MKLKELTKEQQVSIEADGLGKEYLKLIKDVNHPSSVTLICWRDSLEDSCRCSMCKYKRELKRTIKRIDDEIEFLEGELKITKTYNTIGNKGRHSMQIRRNMVRIKRLKKQKELYELMEQLE